MSIGKRRARDFSISGEVVKAGTYIIPREKEGKLTIFAISLLVVQPRLLNYLKLLLRELMTLETAVLSMLMLRIDQRFSMFDPVMKEVKARLF